MAHHDPHGSTRARNELAAELRRRRLGKQLELPTHDHGWTDDEIAECEAEDRAFVEREQELVQWTEEARERLK